MALESEQTVEEEESQQEVLLPYTTIVTHCIYKNDMDRLVQSFEDDADPYKENIMDLINERDDDGKSPLDLAASMGRINICRELLKRGADITSVTEAGYCPLHHAAAWGRVGVLKVLVEFNANLQQRNIHGERARETAARYGQTECVDFLDWAEARMNLADYIKLCHESVTDPEKAAGRVAKDEKNMVLGACKEKTEWLENTADATTQDFISQKQALEAAVAHIMQKLSEPPPEKHEKK